MDMPTYKIVRFFQDPERHGEVIDTGLTLEEAQERCSDPETSSDTARSREARELTAKFGPWFDGYFEE